MSSAKTATARPVVLIIRDGWGVSPSPATCAAAEGNATLLAHTPVQDRLIAECPHCFLTASGEAVGLPEGQMGNSEVGHLNLGAGRIVYQDLTRISLAVRDGSFFKNPVLLDLIERSRGGRLHLMGLVSDGGVHSHEDHLIACLDLAKQQGVKEVFIHAFTDGRDTSPTSGAASLAKVAAHAAKIGLGRIVSIVGRYFAMDRDNRWERTSQAYNALVRAEGYRAADPASAMSHWYAEGKTDEFIPASVIATSDDDAAGTRLKSGDGVIFFNFRSDRARQITRALMLPDFKGFDVSDRPALAYACMTEYDETFGLPIAFPTLRLDNLFCDVLAEHGKTQLRAAETEKYPHVTYFFNGGREAPVEGEERCMIPSPKVATYDLQPEMSALELTDAVTRHLVSGRFDAMIINFANPDMVGHTGVVAAGIKAVETVDACVGKFLETLAGLGGAAIIIADHGNCERMIAEDGTPHTAHTTNLVHCIYTGPGAPGRKMHDGILADVAPTLLDLMGLPKPDAMTGKSLFDQAAK